jgi:hypothetical protein
MLTFIFTRHCALKTNRELMKFLFYRTELYLWMSHEFIATIRRDTRTLAMTDYCHCLEAEANVSVIIIIITTTTIYLHSVFTILETTF